MFLFSDVAYTVDLAVAAGIACADHRSAAGSGVYFFHDHIRHDYQPGAFFLRELPPLLGLIERVPVALELIFIDAYVWLSVQGRPGLGAHLYTALQRRVPVIGVAKRCYRGNPGAELVYRGRSRRPLYVTAAGVEPRLAAQLVAEMHGRHRMPALLSEVDQLARRHARDLRLKTPHNAGTSATGEAGKD